MLGVDAPRWLGPIALVVGVAILASVRRIADANARAGRAEATVAQRLVPRRARGSPRSGLRAGDTDSVGDRFLRWVAVALVGVALLLAGLAALLGAWSGGS
jgi:hypothetical protein